jgi:hypothetical protein
MLLIQLTRMVHAIIESRQFMLRSELALPLTFAACT